MSSATSEPATTTNSNGAPKTWADAIAILDQRGPERHPVHCPELGGLTVYVRGLSRNESLRIERATNKGNGKADTALGDKMQFLWGVVEPAITEREYNELKQTPAASPALQRIHDKISKLTGIVTDDKNDGEEVDAVSAAESFPGRAS